jgi:hypothetical protein
MPFNPIYDLESLTEEQRQKYYLDACQHYSLPPELSALAFIWMETGDGKRNLTLYAKKAATDIIRANKQISTTKLTKDEGRGYVAWIVEGKDATGRTEMAVGSASTEGLKGTQLATAVMLAQTRGTRRMTLQFVGGLLDESELNETTTDINRSSTSLASMATLPAPQPQVEPNSQAGKDVTEDVRKAVDPNTALDSITDAVLLNPNRKSGFNKMVAPEPFSSGSIIPQPIPGVEPIEKLVEIEQFNKYPTMAEAAKTITDPVVLAAADALVKELVEGKPRRRRRTKAEMEAARNNVNASEDFGAPYLGPEHIKAKEEELKVAMQPLYDPEPPFNIAPEVLQAGNEIIQNLAETMKPLFAAAQESEYPTKEQEDAYRARLKVYTNEILKNGGMTDGIIWRVKRYTMHLFPDAIVENGKLKLTVKQWDQLLATFDERVKVLGPGGLVLIINEVAEKA